MSGLLNILTESVNEVPRIEFPNLFDKSIIVNRVAFNLFGVDIYWYGVIIAVGVILAFIYAMHKCKQFGLIPDHVFDVAFVAIIFGFIGARAYYCIFIDTDINSLICVTEDLQYTAVLLRRRLRRRLPALSIR